MRPRAVVPAPRRGFVLLLVLVALPMLALGGYAFTHLMRAEARASRVAAREAQVRWLADAGVQQSLALLNNKAQMLPGSANLTDSAASYANVAVAGGSRQGYFSLVAPDPGSSSGIRYGLVNECGKIPLRSKRVPLNRAMLMGVPNMTEDLADKIVDWIDADNTALELGAEAETYSGQALTPRNGDLPTLDELLGVSGMTPALFYGEDADRDGFLGAHERDGNQRWPPDNGDDTLDRGMRSYFTIDSKAGNLDPDGYAKTNLNGDAKAGAAALAAKFTPDIAAYYVLYKSKADGQQLKAVSDLVETNLQIKSTEALAALTAAGLDPAAAMAKFGIPPPTPMTVGGGGRGPGGGGGFPQPEPDVPVASPWKAASAGDFLENLLLYFAIDGDKVLVGVIDPSQAPAAVLQALPGIDADTASSISNAAANRKTAATVAWLMVDGVLTPEKFRAIEPCVSMQSQSYSVQSVGFLDDGGPIGRVHAVIDASGKIPKVVSRIDLSGLPCGISWERLKAGAADLNP